MEHTYKDKDDEYFLNIRKELLDMIPLELRNGNILEIGAGEGNTLVYAKENGYAKEIYGVELCKIENSNQTNPIFSDFIIANIEDSVLPFELEKFDVIICADVLEHLVDPYSTVEKLKKHLKDGGAFISSIPNIKEYSTLKKIIVDGDFRYEDAGILDRTHLRFFTKKNIIELFEQRGFTIEKIIHDEICDSKRYIKQLRLFKFIGCIIKNIFTDFFVYQYFILASKNKDIKN
ncbi:class I SAM-dependent methyltransferase [Sulfurimonas sp.]